MAQSHSRVLAKLHAAAADHRAVRLIRSPRHADDVEAVVLAIGLKWVLCAEVVEAGYLDKTMAFRIDDIRSVEPAGGFSDRALALLSPWPPELPVRPIRLDRTRDLLADLGADVVLVGLEEERDHDAMWIGEVALIERRRVWLHEIQPDATWEGEPVAYRLRAITAISAGGRYMTALREVGGVAPPLPPRVGDPE